MYKYVFESLFLISLVIYLGVELGYMVILCLTFLRNHQTCHSDCTIFHFHWQCTRVPIFSHLRQMLVIFLKYNHLVDVKWHIIVVFTYISLMTNHVEHIFLYLLAISRSLKKCLFNSFAHFLNFFCLFGVEL